ncbi:MAG: TldD/PmbA family protein [Pseudomonadota bacterium]|nr:TldD/PmbA family protein [Pseudomonadota bacterium]
MARELDEGALARLTQALVEAARKAGAEAADVVAVIDTALSAEVRLGKLEETQRSEETELGLRVFVGRRQAVVSTNDPRPEGFTALAERAVAMARVAPENPYAGLAPMERLARDEPDLDLFDVSAPTAAELEQRALAAEDAARAVPGVTNSGGASASYGVGGLVLATSEGFVGGYRATMHSVSVSAIAGDGTGMERDYDFSVARHLAELEPAEEIGRRAGERAVRRLNPRKVETQRATVVYDPRVASSLLGHLAGAANGASVARGTSFLKDRLGERLFAEGVRVVDDPVRRRGLSSRPFDAEGVSAEPLAIIENGVLASWVLDTASARELGLETTGHAQRGAGSTPSPGVTNLTLMPGGISPEDLVRDVGDGLYVTELIGRGANLVTGDYSRGAGFWIENGELAYPVSEITIAGTLPEMFRAMVPADDLVYRRAVNAPTVAVEGMTIAGR